MKSKFLILIALVSTSFLATSLVSCKKDKVGCTKLSDDKYDSDATELDTAFCEREATLDKFTGLWLGSGVNASIFIIPDTTTNEDYRIKARVITPPYPTLNYVTASVNKSVATISLQNQKIFFDNNEYQGKVEAIIKVLSPTSVQVTGDVTGFQTFQGVNTQVNRSLNGTYNYQ